jgi:hypothetical protein
MSWKVFDLEPLAAHIDERNLERRFEVKLLIWAKELPKIWIPAAVGVHHEFFERNY